MLVLSHKKKTSTVHVTFLHHSIDQGHVKTGLHRARLVPKTFGKNYCSNFQSKIRGIKYDLIVNLITRMDGKLRDESIKPN